MSNWNQANSTLVIAVYRPREGQGDKLAELKVLTLSYYGRGFLFDRKMKILLHLQQECRKKMSTSSWNGLTQWDQLMGQDFVQSITETSFSSKFTRPYVMFVQPNFNGIANISPAIPCRPNSAQAHSS